MVGEMVGLAVGLAVGLTVWLPCMARATVLNVVHAGSAIAMAASDGSSKTAGRRWAAARTQHASSST